MILPRRSGPPSFGFTRNKVHCAPVAFSTLVLEGGYPETCKEKSKKIQAEDIDSGDEVEDGLRTQGLPMPGPGQEPLLQRALPQGGFESGCQCVSLSSRGLCVRPEMSVPPELRSVV